MAQHKLGKKRDRVGRWAYYFYEVITMSYTPTDWKTWDVITAEKLNKAEDGIKNAQPFIVTITTQDEETYTSDKTYAEVGAAIDNGLSVIFRLMYANTDFYDITTIIRAPTNISGCCIDVGSFASGNLELIYTCVELSERGTVNVIDTTYLIGNVSEG